MGSGWERTLEVLGRTRNEAATELLVRALDHPAPAIHEAALRTLLRRRNLAGQEEILRRWPELPDRWKQILEEQPGRLNDALRDAILNSEPARCQPACDAIVRLGEYDLVPTMLTAAEAESNPNAGLIATTILRLCERLFDELAGGKQGAKRNPLVTRQHVVAILEPSVRRMARHGRREIVEAFLLLAGRDNALLRKILNDPYDKAHAPALAALTAGERPGILRLLLSFLDDTAVPPGILRAIVHRQDRTWVQRLLRKIGYEPATAVRNNLRQIDRIPWLRGELALVDELDDAEQHAAIRLAEFSSLDRGDVFTLIRHVLQRGKTGGRRAAAKALANFRGAEANQLALASLNDSDPQVRAALVGQLRQRNIPGALQRLVQFIESPEAPVREAARGALGEFNFRQFAQSFDGLDEEVRRSTGRLVKKVDTQAIAQLTEEIAARQRSRRLRGLLMVVAMEAAQELEPAILALLADEDHFVRAAAAHALAGCRTPAACAALRGALLDRSVTVQQAAEESLLQLTGGNASVARQSEVERMLLAGLEQSADVPSSESPPQAAEVRP